MMEVSPRIPKMEQTTATGTQAFKLMGNKLVTTKFMRIKYETVPYYSGTLRVLSVLAASRADAWHTTTAGRTPKLSRTVRSLSGASKPIKILWKKQCQMQPYLCFKVKRHYVQEGVTRLKVERRNCWHSEWIVELGGRDCRWSRSLPLHPEGCQSCPFAPYHQERSEFRLQTVIPCLISP